LDKPNEYYINLIGTWMDLLIALWRTGRHEECMKVSQLVNKAIGGGWKIIQ